MNEVAGTVCRHIPFLGKSFSRHLLLTLTSLVHQLIFFLGYVATAVPPIIIINYNNNRMGTIHRTLLLISTTKKTMARSTARPTINLNPPIAVHSADADLPTTEEIKPVKDPAADFPVLIPAVLRIVVGPLIAHNGLPASLMVALARLALR